LYVDIEALPIDDEKKSFLKNIRAEIEKKDQVIQKLHDDMHFKDTRIKSLEDTFTKTQKDNFQEQEEFKRERDSRPNITLADYENLKSFMNSEEVKKLTDTIENMKNETIQALEKSLADKEVEIKKKETEKLEILKDKTAKGKEVAELQQKGLDSDKEIIRQLQEQVANLTVNYNNANQRIINEEKIKTQTQQELNNLRVIASQTTGLQNQISSLNASYKSIESLKNQAESDLAKEKGW
jgi:hypothetical protein